MKSTLPLIAFASLIASTAPAQDFDVAVVVGKRGVEPAIARRIGTLDHAFNTRWNIDVSAFAGSKLEGGALFGGFSLSVPLKLSDGIDFCPGVYARFVQSRPVQGGLFFGFRVR